MSRRIAIFSTVNPSGLALVKVLEPLVPCSLHVVATVSGYMKLLNRLTKEVRGLDQGDVMIFLQDRQDYPIERYYSLTVDLRCPPISFSGPIIVINSSQTTYQYSQISPAALHCIGVEIMELPLSLAKLLHILGINVGDTRVEDYSWPSREARPLWSVRLALQDHIHTAGNCIDRLRSLLRAMSKQSNTEMSEKTKLIIDELENSIDAIEGELYP